MRVRTRGQTEPIGRGVPDRRQAQRGGGGAGREAAVPEGGGSAGGMPASARRQARSWRGQECGRRAGETGRSRECRRSRRPAADAGERGGVLPDGARRGGFRQGRPGKRPGAEPGLRPAAGSAGTEAVRGRGTSGALHGEAGACSLGDAGGPAGRLPGSTVRRGFAHCRGDPGGLRAREEGFRGSADAATALSTPREVGHVDAGRVCQIFCVSG